MADLVATGRVAYHPDVGARARRRRRAHGHVVAHGAVTRRCGYASRSSTRRYLNTAVPCDPPAALRGRRAGRPASRSTPWPTLRTPPAAYVVVGAGKTGIDACLWLLERGVDPDVITWVVPRDSWLLNRRYVQPGESSSSTRSGRSRPSSRRSPRRLGAGPVARGWSESGQLLRLDPGVEPTMYHAAVVSRGRARGSCADPRRRPDGSGHPRSSRPASSWSTARSMPPRLRCTSTARPAPSTGGRRCRSSTAT